MSVLGSSEEIGVLRGAMARIEGDGHSGASAFSGRTRRKAAVTLGQGTMLDAVLKAGIGRGALHEIVAASPGDAAAASGFALALAARFAAARAGPVVWIVEDHAKTEMGAPYAPGLAAHGIDPAHLILVEAANGQDGLWAMEEALKCEGVSAVVGEIWRLKSYNLAASRRLVLAAQKSGTPALMVPAGAAGAATAMSSAARTRFEVRAMSSVAWARSEVKAMAGATLTRFELKAMPVRHPASASNRIPPPGRAAWEVRVARIRAGPDTFALDHNRFWPVLWDHEEACFRDALSLPLSTPARDRPDRPRLDLAWPVARTA